MEISESSRNQGKSLSIVNRVVSALHRLRRRWKEQRLVASLREMQSTQAGHRCVVMGNGPSLNDMDLHVFAKEKVWCTNRAYLLFDRIKWRPKFFTAIDRRVVPDIAGELNELPRSLPSTQFFWPTHFYGDHLQAHSNVHWFREHVVDEQDFPDSVFSNDCSKSVVHGRTVTITALQLAVYLGFNPNLPYRLRYELHDTKRDNETGR